VAIVTAAAGAGIGQATVRRLAAEGASVVVTDAHEKRTMEVAEDLKSKEYKAMGGCNVTGTFYCCRAVLATMIKQRSGSIINISAAVAWLGSDGGEVHYTAAKAGFTEA